MTNLREKEIEFFKAFGIEPKLVRFDKDKKINGISFCKYCNELKTCQTPFDELCEKTIPFYPTITDGQYLSLNALCNKNGLWAQGDTITELQENILWEIQRNCELFEENEIQEVFKNDR